MPRSSSTDYTFNNWLQKLYRKSGLDQENDVIDLARKTKTLYNPEVLSNGDTLKQQLARSRYLLYKSEEKWTHDQAARAIYAYTRLAKWHERVEKAGFKAFNTISKTIINHYKRILNYFNNRSTNASAESFNAKINVFRANHRGVTDVNFFLFRLIKLYD